MQRQSVRSTLSGAPIAAARPGTPPPAIPPPFHRPDPRTAEQRTVESGTVESQTREARSAPSSPSGARPAAPNAVAAGMGSAGRTHESLPAASAPTPGAPVRVSSGRPASQPPAVPVSQGSRPSPAVVGPPSTPPARPAPRPTPAAIDPDHKDFDTLIGRSTEILTTRRFDPTPIVLGLVALAVVIGLVLAWKALTAPASIGDGQSVGTTSGQGTTAPSGEATQPADDGGEAPAAVLPVIASAQMIDPPPDGDNNEHPEAVPLALDGDPATAWYSRTYASPTFGMKAGIGYAVTLQAPATVTTVTLTVNGTGGMVEVRATDPATPTAGDVLASGALSSQTVLTLSAPTQTQTIVLWFTALPQTADGANRLELAEVAVS
ncbi:MAG: hypothetical protein HGA44_12940 [Cellulomonadaceae bacterium]|nr:hypothetical protein [Cellulomonadaceae bacterium]